MATCEKSGLSDLLHVTKARFASLKKWILSVPLILRPSFFFLQFPAFFTTHIQKSVTKVDINEARLFSDTFNWINCIVGRADGQAFWHQVT